MKFTKKGIALSAAAMTVLCMGTTAFAAVTLNIERVNDSSVVIGTNAEKEADGIARISFDMGDTWEPQSEYVSPENTGDYWTYEAYKAYAEMVTNGLEEMYAAGEPGLTEEDIRACKEGFAQMLAFIKAGGKVSQDAIGADSEIMTSCLDGSVIERVTEK